MNFSERFKLLRLEKGLSIKELSKNINYSDTAIGRWENGKRIPNADVIIKYAQFFEVSADYILGLSDY